MPGAAGQRLQYVPQQTYMTRVAIFAGEEMEAGDTTNRHTAPPWPPSSSRINGTNNTVKIIPPVNGGE